MPAAGLPLHQTLPWPLVLQTTSPPGKLRRKTVYFLKLARVPLVKEDLDKLVGAADGHSLATDSFFKHSSLPPIPSLALPHSAC